MPRLVLLFALLLLCPAAGRARPAPQDAFLPARPDALVVKYRARGRAAGVDGSLDRLDHELHVRGARPLFPEHPRKSFPTRAARAPAGRSVPDLLRIWVLDLPPGTDVAAAAARYAADPAVEYAHPDYEVRATSVPNDPFFASSGTWGQPYADLWGLHAMHADSAWSTAAGSGIVVAVVDTGVDPTHPDLTGQMWTNLGEIPGNHVDDDGNGYVDDVRGWDFFDHDATPDDLHGHGTHVAGTIAARGNDATGVVGMAWQARIMPVRGLGAGGFGYVSDLAQALVYAAENGADVINNSWGGGGIAQVVADAVDTALGLGAVVVAAAGNAGGSVDTFEPAGIPGVIAVGASQPLDTIAGFSNHGRALSVAAPGVDVLSLRGATSDPVGGVPVASRWLRLSGTSMASPHAAGLAAVLLSALPSLTADEVRWHLELNAEQPGYPGWEGQPWNPYFGWGRLDAAHVFDPPPVTTRLRGPELAMHALADTVTPAATTIDVGFTTHLPVAWVLAGPPWLTPSLGVGVGPATVPLVLDATGVAVGSHTDDLIVTAPTAVDGGGRVPATLHVHADPRIGGEIVVAPGLATLPHPARAASDGVGAMVVWDGWTAWPPALFAARVDGDGTVHGPITLRNGYPYKDFPAIASDGRDFLVVWHEEDASTINGKRSGTVSVLAMRVSAAGQPLDAMPTVLYSRAYRDDLGVATIDVAFDGDAYVAVWADWNSQTDTANAWFRRIGRDASLRSSARKFYPNAGTTLRQVITPRVACTPGRCLIAWHEADGETNAVGHYVDKLWGVRVTGDRVLDLHPVRLLTDVESMVDLATDGTGWFALGDRAVVCPGPVLCSWNVVGTRITADAVALDPNGIRLDTGTSAGATGVAVGNVIHDGTSWVTSFQRLVPGDAWQVFGARVGSSGGVVDDEEEGLLLHAPATATSAELVALRTHDLLVWNDLRGGVPSVRAQRLLAHAATSVLPARTIGAIGARQVAERSLLSFTVDAPTLGPTATFTVSNLPPGAVFDAATRTFRWIPSPTEVGTYPGVHFAATNGIAAVAENVTVTVTEAMRAVSGTVRRPDGAPVPGAAVRITGTPGGARIVTSDAAGRYHVDDLPARLYVVRMTAPTTRTFRAAPASIRASVLAADVQTADFILTPK